MKQVIIMQGVPGSGKSTIAEKHRNGATNFGISCVTVSADLFFTRNGNYNFVASKLGSAHGACLREFISALDDAFDLVIVDNTNTTAVEIAPYYAIAEAYGYQVKILRVECDYEIAAGRNVHGVPGEAVMRMHVNMTREVLPRRWNLEIAK